MQFTNIKTTSTKQIYTFTLSPLHVSYANTLRRLILTGVETIGFRADMTSTGSTTDVIVKKNDTPMTNEMLADRIGLLPIHITAPLNYKMEQYTFVLQVDGNKDETVYVTSSDFKVYDNDVKADDGDQEATRVPTERFFLPNPITGDTCLIATLEPGNAIQRIEIIAIASKGTGREHARFCSVSQCSYEYTVDENPQRMEEMFLQWLTVSKKIGSIDKASERYTQLQREFNTMQRKRCFLLNEKGDPYSYDFTIESAGVLSVYDIIDRACQIGENMCSKYTTITKGALPSEITISSSDSRIIGYDFLIRGHDHTLGNLLQTWLVENYLDKNPNITYAGYSIPHPLRDELLLRIGVKDGETASALEAFEAAAIGCVVIFREMRAAWQNANRVSQPVARSMRKVRPRIGMNPSQVSVQKVAE